MAVKYLSEEFYKELNNKIQSSEAVLGAAKGQNVSIQNVVTDTPEGEVKNWLKLADGTPEVGLGELEGADATVTQSYETAVSIAKGELNGQNAFMQGKLKIAGNMMKVMQLQGFLQAFGAAANEIDTEF
ncbi:MAG: SCP2 sterol-binding domain-containing protein [Actinomycetota bacterium]|nr:SCP2 sterol-binding domain-containing protein [Actinomycetota bacterium]